MRRIRYAGGAYTTGDDIADAVIEYAARLARSGTVELVDLRIRHVDGTTGLARLLIGDAIPIASETLAQDGFAAELEDPETVANLRRRTSGLGRSPAPELGLDSSYRFFDDTLDL